MIRAIVLVVLLIIGWSEIKADECIEPISDAELFKLYKPCYGGWCLR